MVFHRPLTTRRPHPIGFIGRPLGRQDGGRDTKPNGLAKQKGMKHEEKWTNYNFVFSFWMFLTGENMIKQTIKERLGQNEDNGKNSMRRKHRPGR